MPIIIRCSLLFAAISLVIFATAPALAEEVDFREVDFYLKRGTEFLEAGDIDHAMIDFEGAILQGFWIVAPHVSLANAKLRDEDYQGAIYEYNEALKHNQNKVYDAKRLNQNLDEEQRLAKKWDVNIYTSRGSAYVGMKQYSLAIQDCERVIGLEPKNAEAQNNCAAAYRELGEFTRALEYYNEAIRLRPEFDVAWAGRGRTYSRIGRYQDAENDCNKAMQIRAHSTSGLLCLGETFKAQGKTTAAIDNYSEFLSINPLSQPARDALAELTQNPILKQKRVALVIGNGAYKNAPLETTINDAKDMSAALTKLGFAVLTGKDFNLLTMTNIFKRFARRAKDADVALVFYSGHGGEYRDANYLVPIEDNMQWPREAAEGFARYINLQDQVDGIKNLARARILIVDACRTEGGFAKIEKTFGPDRKKTNVTEGMYIAFASAPDHFSYDGAKGNRNSPFTAALLRNLSVGGIELRDLFTRVRNEAYTGSGQLELPQIWDNMPDEFRFYPTNAQLILTGQ